MSMTLTTTLIGFAVGMAGTGLGGLLSFFIKNPSKKLLSFILGFSGGLMLSIVCFDLLPEAFEIGHLYIGVIGIIGGVMTIVWLDEMMPHRDEEEAMENGFNFIKTGILLSIGVALHNLPEGLAIGSGFMATQELGIGISIVIALHNVPEGVSMVTPLRIGGMSRIRAFLYTVMAGIPMGLGAFIGVSIGGISKNLIAFCLAFAGGTMLYITCGELIPKSQKLNFGKISSYGILLGFIVGMVISKKL